MNNKNLIQISFLNSFGTLAYIALVSLIMDNGEKLFGKMGGALGPVAFLLLFIFSASVTGLLVAGRPVYLFLEGQKKEAIKLLVYTVAWLFVYLVLVFAYFFLTQ